MSTDFTYKKYNVNAPFPDYYTKERKSLLSQLFTKSFITFYKKRHYKMKMGYPRKKGGSRTISLCQNDYVSQVLSDYKLYPKSKKLHTLLSPLLGDSIFTTNGDTWKFQRNIMNKSFAALQPKKTFDLMNQAIDSLITVLDSKSQGSSHVIIDSLMTYITANIIFSTIFSIDFSVSESTKLYNNFNEYQKYSYLLDSPYKYIFKLYFKHQQKRYVSKIHSQFHPEIDKRFRDKDTNYENDILGNLMNQNNGDNGDKFSQKDLNEQICMLFLAGHETSATALTWSLYLISQCNTLQDDLYKEITDSLVDGKITYKSLKQMHLYICSF